MSYLYERLTDVYFYSLFVGAALAAATWGASLWLARRFARRRQRDAAAPAIGPTAAAIP